MAVRTPTRPPPPPPLSVNYGDETDKACGSIRLPACLSALLLLLPRFRTCVAFRPLWKIILSPREMREPLDALVDRKVSNKLSTSEIIPILPSFSLGRDFSANYPLFRII